VLFGVAVNVDGDDFPSRPPADAADKRCRANVRRTMPVSALRGAMTRDYFVARNPHGMPQSVRAAG